MVALEKINVVFVFQMRAMLCLVKMEQPAAFQDLVSTAHVLLDLRESHATWLTVSFIYIV